MEIHPPNLRSAGLAAALGDLLAPLSARGIESSLEVDGDLELGQDTELLLFRAAGEALRNVQNHARARSVTVRLVSSAGPGLGPVGTHASRERRIESRER